MRYNHFQLALQGDEKKKASLTIGRGSVGRVTAAGASILFDPFRRVAHQQGVAVVRNVSFRQQKQKKFVIWA